MAHGLLSDFGVTGKPRRTRGRVWYRAYDNPAAADSACTATPMATAFHPENSCDPASVAKTLSMHAVTIHPFASDSQKGNVRRYVWAK